MKDKSKSFKNNLSKFWLRNVLEKLIHNWTIEKGCCNVWIIFQLNIECDATIIFSIICWMNYMLFLYFSLKNHIFIFKVCSILTKPFLTNLVYNNKFFFYFRIVLNVKLNELLRKKSQMLNFVTKKQIQNVFSCLKKL